MKVINKKYLKNNITILPISNNQASMTNKQSSINNGNKKIFDIHQRIFLFVVEVLKLTKILPKTPQNLVFTNQIIRSSTSVGANYQEADGTKSKKDFLRILTIVKKEIKETNYWLKLIIEMNLRFKDKIKIILDEGQQIEAIISSIIQKNY